MKFSYSGLHVNYNLIDWICWPFLNWHMSMLTSKPTCLMIPICGNKLQLLYLSFAWKHGFILATICIMYQYSLMPILVTLIKVMRTSILSHTNALVNLSANCSCALQCWSIICAIMEDEILSHCNCWFIIA